MTVNIKTNPIIHFYLKMKISRITRKKNLNEIQSITHSFIAIYNTFNLFYELFSRKERKHSVYTAIPIKMYREKYKDLLKCAVTS